MELFGLKCEMCLREVKGMLGVLEKMSVVFYRGKKVYMNVRIWLDKMESYRN